MVNNIPSYYNVKLFLKYGILEFSGPKMANICSSLYATKLVTRSI